MDLQTVLRVYKNKDTANSQLKHYFEKYFGLKTLKE